MSLKEFIAAASSTARAEPSQPSDEAGIAVIESRKESRASIPDVGVRFEYSVDHPPRAILSDPEATRRFAESVLVDKRRHDNSEPTP